MVYYPALITSAIFFAAIVVNFRNRNNANAFGIGLLAIPSIVFLSYLSQKNMDILAYFLLLVPITIVVAGYEMGIKKEEQPIQMEKPTVPPRIESTEEVTNKCNKCTVSPCMCPYKPPFK
jgi:hypothetical protein